VATLQTGSGVRSDLRPYLFISLSLYLFISLSLYLFISLSLYLFISFYYARGFTNSESGIAPHRGLRLTAASAAAAPAVTEL
jgi:hypothetical protein